MRSKTFALGSWPGVLELLAAAEEELEQAANWYEDAREGLGLDLLVEVLRARELVSEHPEVGGLWLADGVPAGVRRVLLRRFPYHLVYVTEPRSVVVALAHLRRKPGYWAARLQEL